MNRIGYACCLLLAVHVARAQVSTSADVRILSDHWRCITRRYIEFRLNS